MYFVAKTMLSAVVIAIVSTVSKRYPGIGGLIASLPLISILGAIWLWRERPDPALMSAHLESTFWFVLPSLPMFLLVPALLRREVPFWPAMAIGCLVTIGLYGAMLWVGPRLGLKL